MHTQPCFRAEDIDEVGDARHTTFFEMLGNWSLGDYFKEEQLSWLFEFLTGVVGLDPMWGELFAGAEVAASVVELGNSRLAGMRGVGDARIVLYDESQCWWSRSGPPAKMPVGEPGGPDSEVFYLFPQVEHDNAFGDACHPHCDCGRFVEIGNSVFMQYRRTTEGFKPLPQPNVDFGGGLERLAMAAIDTPEVFAVDLLAPIVDTVSEMAQQADPDRRALRIVADHARAVTFLGLDGVEPSNNTQGYVMRRFARRALRQGLHMGIESGLLARLVDAVADIYSDAYPELVQDTERVRKLLDREEDLFRRTLARGVRELPKLARDGVAFKRLGMSREAVSTLWPPARHTYEYYLAGEQPPPPAVSSPRPGACAQLPGRVTGARPSSPSSARGHARFFKPSLSGRTSMVLNTYPISGHFSHYGLVTTGCFYERVHDGLWTTESRDCGAKSNTQVTQIANRRPQKPKRCPRLIGFRCMIYYL